MSTLNLTNNSNWSSYSVGLLCLESIQKAISQVIFNGQLATNYYNCVNSEYIFVYLRLWNDCAARRTRSKLSMLPRRQDNRLGSPVVVDDTRWAERFRRSRNVRSPLDCNHDSFHGDHAVPGYHDGYLSWFERCSLEHNGHGSATVN